MITEALNFIERTLLGWIAKFFAAVKIPEELVGIKGELAHTILVTQSKSLVINGLLLSFAVRLGLVEANRLESVDFEELFEQPTKQLSGLTWASMHDLAKLSWPKEQIANDTLKFRTFNVFQVKGPIRKWPSFKPSFFWLWGLLATRRILTVTLGEAIPFFQQSPQRLLRLIKIDIVRTLKLVRGAPFEPREEQARAILSGPEFEREIQILSDRSGISTARGRRLAEAAFYELAASPRRFMYDALSLVARTLVNRLFTTIETRGLERLIPAIKEHTVVLVPMHRSHLDYVLVGYKLFSEKVNPPLVAAGINLAFFPFGFLFRSVGAYFVKRNARDRFHAVVLKRYVSYLVSRGHLQEFFIEGGRSRSGKMLPPKFGLLSVIVDAWKPEHKRDILFVPVSITYENVVEDESFGRENSGGSKVRESIGSTVRALDVFGKKYGEVIIEFGDPISQRLFRSNLTKGESEKVSEKILTQKLGFEICRAIRDQTNPGLSSLGYTSLLMAPHYGLKRKQLREQIYALSSYLDLVRKHGFKVGSNTPQLQRLIDGDLEALSDLSSAGVVRIERHFSSDYFYIPGNKRYTADYYRNSVVHYFFPVALMGLCQIAYGSVESNQLHKIYPIFEHDLLLEPWSEFLKKIENLTGILVQAGLAQKRESDQAIVFSDAGRKYLFPAILSGFLQSYQWVSENLVVEASDRDSVVSEKFSHDKFVQRLLSASKVSTYVGALTRTESSSQSTIVSVLSSLEARSLIKFVEGSSHNRCIEVNPSALDALKDEIRLLAELNGRIRHWQLEKTVSEQSH